MKFRDLNSSELEKVCAYIVNRYDTSLEEARVIAKEGSKCIDSYISDGPGYAGHLYFIMFTGDPSFYQILDNDFSPVPQSL